ncbi:MAG: 2-hydroxyacyl-CoA dehydratase [Deferribacteraceae bacterium]|jgi:benzoyl-CoA reductase/2-hydroxyglutaryl-CoA dehydratase subunit BcrC/BadD/HgdB|nr:2-hydroxyacyl-CoA dehydratase [Deferribacteraceae bacterium]
MKRIGITATIPVEAVFAASLTPVDLNNVFITNFSPSRFIDAAHSEGFPRNVCSWVKAMYSVARQSKIDAIIAVANGDCSNNQTIAELFKDMGIKVHEFSFPTDPHAESARRRLIEEIDNLCAFLGIDREKLYAAFEDIKRIRRKLKELDELTAKGYVTGEENHSWLVSSSDFKGDLELFEHDLDAFLISAKKRPPKSSVVRLAFVGVPPLITNLYEYINRIGAEVVYNEVQRQFAQFTMLDEKGDIYDQYLNYTYPYSVAGRIKDIKENLQTRNAAGVIHYVQSFCHRQMHDLLFRKHIELPLLSLEADAPGKLDERSKIRLESFVEMLRGKTESQ